MQIWQLSSTPQQMTKYVIVVVQRPLVLRLPPCGVCTAPCGQCSFAVMTCDVGLLILTEPLFSLLMVDTLVLIQISTALDN